MKVYLINAETNKILETFEDVIEWDYDFVEFNNSGNRARIYRHENEYFTDEEPTDEEVIVEEQE